MIRACKLALSWPTATKRQRYQELIVEWRRVVQTYIHQTWEAKSLSKSAPVEKASSGPRSRGKRASGARLGPTVPRTKNRSRSTNAP